MEIKPLLIPQPIYDWANQHKGALEQLYNDFCKETNNPDNTDFTAFCHHMYFECKH